MILRKRCLHQYHAICTSSDDIFYNCTIYANSTREAIELCEETDLYVNSILETKQVHSNESPKIVKMIFMQNISKSDITPCELGEMKWYSERRR